ncbi:MAG: hypothetical protein E7548_05950 [Ruminococcaceae bacterium]|nr:hypothetical protein [Oscillospiraceae bacterium]
MWEIILTILKIAGVLACSAVIVVLCKLWGPISDAISAISDFAEKAQNKILKPVSHLYNKAKGFILKKIPFTLNCKMLSFKNLHPNLGSEKSVNIFLMDLGIIALTVIIYLLKNEIGEYIGECILSLPLVFLLQTINGDVSFSIVALLSAGFSGMLIQKFFTACLEGYSCGRSVIRRLVTIGYYIVTTAAACAVGMLLRGAWEFLAKTGVSLFDFMKGTFSGADDSFFSILGAIFSGIILLLLIYIATIFLIVSIKEYFEALCFGLWCVIGLIMVLIIGWIVFPNAFFVNGIGTPLVSVVFAAFLFVPDYLRVSRKNK